jgi:hypothetical protein
MQYEALSHTDRVEKSIILTNRLIVKALQSDRGDIIRVMNVAGLKNMLKSVFNGVYNKLAVDAQRAYDCAVDKYELDQDCIVVVQDEKFKPRPDVEIEEDVSAFFEIDGKLQYREVKIESLNALPRVDKSGKWLTQQMKWGVHGMQYNPYSLADRLEKAGILTDIEIMKALQDERGDTIRAMSYADLKRDREVIFSIYFHTLYTEAANNFEQACEDYVPERDGIEYDPRKTFKPKNVFEINQEIEAYFEEQGTLH